MRMIRISDYNDASMKLGKPIYDNKGRVLLAEGRIIHPNILKKVISMGLSHLIVDDFESDGITLSEMFDMPTWVDAIQVLEQVFQAIKNKEQFPLIPVQKIVQKLINEVKKRQVIVLIPSTYVGDEARIYAHSVNVALLALQTAKALGYNEITLSDLAIGVLLHDIGRTVTDDENKHPEAGFNILRNIRELNLLSAHIALQHHEALNGTGYPRGIKGDKFIEFAQICGIANEYDNFIHKQNIPPHEALEILMTKSGTNYNEDIVRNFVYSTPAYTPGTLVQLNNGSKAVVTAIKSHMHRPSIRILGIANEISLVEHPTIIITKVIEDETKEKQKTK